MQMASRKTLVTQFATVGLCALMGRTVCPATAQSAHSRTLICTHNGKEIGSETISVDHTMNGLNVKMSVHLQVKLLGITVYRFDQDSAETWIGNQFETLTSDTSR